MTKINKNKEIILILPDIRSAQNVGAIFRTSDAVGVNKIYLTGYTPQPLDKYGRPRTDIAKAALGAELSVPWEYKKSLTILVKKLKKDGYKIVALEQSDKSIDYKKLKIGDKTVLILGNEVDGVNNKILNQCDTVIEIPMLGIKESLNVSVATGVALFRILNI